MLARSRFRHHIGIGRHRYCRLECGSLMGPVAFAHCQSCSRLKLIFQVMGQASSSGYLKFHSGHHKGRSLNYRTILIYADNRRTVATLDPNNGPLQSNY